MSIDKSEAKWLFDAIDAYIDAKIEAERKYRLGLNLEDCYRNMDSAKASLLDSIRIL